MRKEPIKTEYNTVYRKNALKEKKKIQFNTDLFYNEKQELDELLKKEGISKAHFIRKGKLKLQVKNIISEHGSQQFPCNINFSNFKTVKLKNGLTVLLYKVKIINNNYSYWAAIQFKNEIIYFGTMNYTYSTSILEKLESIDTFFL